MREPVLKQDWHDWKQHPVTKALIHDLIATREGYKEEWADGRYSNDEEKVYRGVCQAYADAVEYIVEQFETIQEETDDGMETD